LRQIIFSWLYFLAKAINEGSMIPPRNRNTKCKVDSALSPMEFHTQQSQKLVAKTVMFDPGNQQSLGMD
jgi:hypothetical protein